MKKLIDACRNLELIPEPARKDHIYKLLWEIEQEETLIEDRKDYIWKLRCSLILIILLKQFLLRVSLKLTR